MGVRYGVVGCDASRETVPDDDRHLRGRAAASHRFLNDRIRALGVISAPICFASCNAASLTLPHDASLAITGGVGTGPRMDRA